jgi:hypothetical protein
MPKLKIMKLKRFIPFFLILGFLFFNALAQKPKSATPLTIGESLTYEGKFSKSLLRGIGVADLTFIVSDMTKNGDYLVKAEARSKGTLLKIFNFKFYQRIESTIDDQQQNVLKTFKRDEQGDRVRESEAEFDYPGKKVTYVETDPKDPARPPRRVASPIESETQDLISAIYAVRRLPFALGKTFELSVSDSGLVYKVPVRVTGREMQKSVVGKSWCWRVEPEVFGENRMIEQEGNMIIWITDDARRIPVRSRIDSEIGRIEVKLKKAETIK